MFKLRLWLSQLGKLMSFQAELPACNRLPIIVILGSTATGKTKLAVDLACKFGGEIISADSMQVYKDLDILTNKATSIEMKGIPHHMIGVVDRKEKFDVIHFRDQALPLVEKVLDARKVPIIVGGTNYYIESILWQVLIGGKGNGCMHSWTTRKRKANSEEVNVTATSSSDASISDNPILRFMQDQGGKVKENEIANWTNQELYSALQMVDPERISKLHPNDRRKVFRSLQVRFQTGRKHSELIAEQCLPLAGDVGGFFGKDWIKESSTDEDGDTKIQLNNNTALGGPLRFPNCFCLWIQADKDILDKRIEERVNNMVQRGLKNELDEYMDILREENSDLNYEEGILQSIGFKEFHSYLQILPTERETKEAEKRFKEGLERLKLVTKQYARKQLKWINQRFLRPSRRQVPPVYRIDGNSTDIEDWERNVTSICIRIVDAHLNNKLDASVLKDQLVVCSSDKIEDDLIARTCETCDNRVFIGNVQWETHLKSGKHRRMVTRKNHKSNESPCLKELHETTDALQ